MPEPTILCIILNFRTPELTLKAAQAAVREMQDMGGEVLIVDNCSGDDSFELLRSEAAEKGWLKAGLVRVVQTGKNRGFGNGNNFGIRLGLSSGEKPDFVYILNSDAWPDPGAVRKLHQAMRADPKVGIAGSSVRGVDDQPHCTAFRFPTIAGEFEGAARTGFISNMLRTSIVPMKLPTQATKVNWVAGASMMLRHRMLDEIGLFDETFFLYFEETELCHRAAQAGWATIYAPASEVVHVGSASTQLKTWARTPRYWYDSRLYYFTKVHGRGYAARATAARIAGCLIWQMRVLVSDKPYADPPRFLRDLVAHSLRGLFKGGTLRRPASFTSPISEESK